MSRQTKFKYMCNHFLKYLSTDFMNSYKSNVTHPNQKIFTYNYVIKISLDHYSREEGQIYVKL